MTKRPALLGIRHVALTVSNLEAAEKFWVDLMGYTIEWRPDADNVYLRSGSDNLALHRGDYRAPVDESGQLDHIGLAVPKPEDVDAWATFLTSRGVTLRAHPRSHRDGSRSLYCYGPEDVLIQIIYHEPLSRPPAAD
jgi:catechol 2,3-dioxygenase-like lactoylglutathione lyase family enzyme